MPNKYLSIFYSTKTENSVAVNHRRFSPRSVRFLNRRNCLVLIAVVGVLTALLLAGADIRHPAQAAPQPQQTAPPPTLADAPSVEPDYTNVDDILDGRRSLLRSDDLTLVGRSNSDEKLDFMVLKTSNSEITDVSPRFIPPVVSPNGPNDTSSTQMGRMFAFEADVMATVYTQTSGGRRIMGVSIYSPTAKTYSTLELADTFSFSTTKYVINATKMADFNHDGFDDLVINYTKPNGQSGIQIINARNVDAFSEGLVARGEENTNTKSMGAYSVVQSLNTSTNIPVDSMTVGDINGDGQFEILGVVPGEGKTGLQLVVHTVDQRTLQIADAKYYPLTGTEADGLIVPQAHIAAAVGKFTTNTHDQLLVAWAVNDHLPVVQLVDFVQGKFTPQLRPFWHGDTVINTKTEGISTDTALLRLKVGRLNWSSQYDEAVLLHGYNRFRTAGSSSYDFTISNLAVSPADFSIRQQSSFKTESQYGTAFDITLGNFDNRSPDPLNPSQTERNPNLQVALLTTDDTGYIANVDIFNIDQTMGTLNKISTRSIPQESPQNNFGFVAGDMQGRSMRLGEPTKITINGTAQPTVVVAAPPMHVDFITAVNERQSKVLNVSAIPENFYTSYETEDKATTQSSSAHTTSWSWGAKESIEGSFEIGSVNDGDGFKYGDTFTAAQALKGSTERTHGSYTTHEFDILQKTNFSDQLWYSESNFNIYIYPVIGQTVCPASKADENGNCADSNKVPLTIQFSGPDHVSYETITADLVEWYQPPWEYGNLFSYPGSYAQLQQIFPDIHKLSTDITWATDTSDLERKTRWATGTTDGTSTGLSQNYSFENDLSVQFSEGVPGFNIDKQNYEFNTSGSFGFNDLNKSTTNLGKSTGIGVNKPGSFLDPPSYNYSVTPYIFGHLKPGGSVDNALLTGDVQTFGLLQTAFVVDPTASTSGGWWKQSYTKTPDIALNHPNRWKLDVYPDSASRPSNCLQLGVGRPSQMNCAEIAPAIPENPWLSEFHDMRGFFISKASNPGEGPQLTTAKVGDKLRLQARVYNYSLKQMNPDAKVHVRFYGMQ